MTRFQITVSMTFFLASMCAAQSAPACKPVTRYGISGCELLPDRTCPPGYHEKVVNPPDPRMMAPSTDVRNDKPEPQQKQQPPDKPPKTNL